MDIATHRNGRIKLKQVRLRTQQLGGFGEDILGLVVGQSTLAVEVVLEELYIWLCLLYTSDAADE